MIDGYELNIPTIKRFIYGIQNDLGQVNKDQIVALKKLIDKNERNKNKNERDENERDENERNLLSPIIKYVFKPIIRKNPINIRTYGYKNKSVNCFYNAALAILSSLTYYTQNINLISEYKKFMDNEDIESIKNKIDLSILSKAFMYRILDIHAKGYIEQNIDPAFFDRFLNQILAFKKLITFANLLNYYEIDDVDITAMSYAYFCFSPRAIASRDSITKLLNYLKTKSPGDPIICNENAIQNSNNFLEFYDKCRDYHITEHGFNNRVYDGKKGPVDQQIISEALNNRKENFTDPTEIEKLVLKYEFLLLIFKEINDVHNGFCNELIINRIERKKIDETKTKNVSQYEHFKNGFEEEMKTKYPNSTEFTTSVDFVPVKNRQNGPIDKYDVYVKCIINNKNKFDRNVVKAANICISSLFSPENIKNLNIEPRSPEIIKNLNIKLLSLYNVLTQYENDDNFTHLSIIGESPNQIYIESDKEDDASAVITLLTSMTYLCGVSPHTLINTMHGSVIGNDNPDEISSGFTDYDILIFKPKYFISKLPLDHLVRKIPSKEFVNTENPEENILKTIELNSELKYSLMGVVYHHGGANAGHYVAYIKDNEKMHLYNDGVYSTVDTCFEDIVKEYKEDQNKEDQNKEDQKGELTQIINELSAIHDNKQRNENDEKLAQLCLSYFLDQAVENKDEIKRLLEDPEIKTIAINENLKNMIKSNIDKLFNKCETYTYNYYVVNVEDPNNMSLTQQSKNISIRLSGQSYQVPVYVYIRSDLLNK